MPYDLVAYVRAALDSIPHGALCGVRVGAQCLCGREARVIANMAAALEAVDAEWRKEHDCSYDDAMDAGLAALKGGTDG